MKDFMETALDIAYSRMGRTSPNPAVGAVIVKDGAVISTGGTAAYGGPHAEAEAIRAALDRGISLKGAEIYVSLEPCGHYGKTPPCAMAIRDAGIGRAHIALMDPNPLVSGSGARILKEGGVDVVFEKEYSESAYDLIRPFEKYIRQKKPFIVYKSAVTLDGRTASIKGDSKWISSSLSRCLVHRMRSKVDAVIVGKNTLFSDNPSLNVRLDEFEQEAAFFAENTINVSGRENGFINRLMRAKDETPGDPLRVIIGLNAGVAEDAHVWDGGNYLVFETEDNYARLLEENPAKRDFLRNLNIFFISGSREERVEAALRELGRRGIMFAMLEGGAALAGSFFDSGNIDQFLYFIAPVLAGAGRPSVDGQGTDFMADAARLFDISSAMISDDILFCGYRNDKCLQDL
ncbi:MAG: bifunctional diaminohydroxyphosphoribosylaminopyrimidine deaminase/5-amino-6-(5-phosphoribosylamino)uracil reductase RibD [Leptospirales bacterium]|nr:bifunctional diaminohydroxyphosphoribosylaminopyrimidine deaminase/5-amino-6-(5-phosphoribosylamino)uracil reductase RibD [Leptospirales bacterium]